MKLISNSVIYFSGSIASRLLSLLSLPFLTRALTPEEYGVIAMLIMVGVFACSLLSMGLGTSIGEVYFREQGRQHRSSVISTGFIIVLLSHSLFGVLAWPLAGTIGKILFHKDEHAYVITMLLTGQLAQNFVFPLQLKIQFEERAKVAALAMILSSVISIGLTLFLVVAEQRGLPGYAEAMFAGAIVQVFIYLGLSHIDFTCIRRSMAKELVHKGWPMILSFVFLFIMQYGVRLPIEWFGGLEVLGLYQIGASLAAPMGMVTSAFVNAWTPYALGFADKPSEASRALAVTTRLYVVLVGAIVILVFLASPWMAKLLVAEKYYESYQVIGLSALWHYYSSIFLLLLPPVYFANEVARAVVRVQAITVLVFVVISVPLIKFAPLIGAGAAVALAGFILVFFQLLWNRVLMSSKYVQIEYDRWTYLWMVFIGLGGVILLTLDLFMGHGASIVAAILMLALLFRAVWGMTSAGQFQFIRNVLGKR